jgi:hypothetical protein
MASLSTRPTGFGCRCQLLLSGHASTHTPVASYMCCLFFQPQRPSRRMNIVLSVADGGIVNGRKGMSFGVWAENLDPQCNITCHCGVMLKVEVLAVICKFFMNRSGRV